MPRYRDDQGGFFGAARGIRTPDGSGRIETHSAVQRPMAARSGGEPVKSATHGPVTVTVNVTVHANGSNPRGISQEVPKALR